MLSNTLSRVNWLKAHSMSERRGGREGGREGGKEGAKEGEMEYHDPPASSYLGHWLPLSQDQGVAEPLRPFEQLSPQQTHPLYLKDRGR